jgi:hypothetical protein
MVDWVCPHMTDRRQAGGPWLTELDLALGPLQDMMAAYPGLWHHSTSWRGPGDEVLSKLELWLDKYCQMCLGRYENGDPLGIIPRVTVVCRKLATLASVVVGACQGSYSIADANAARRKMVKLFDQIRPWADEVSRWVWDRREGGPSG